MHSISVVVPMYNEEANVRPLYEAVTRVLKKMGRKYEIVVANDGSTDATLPRLKELAHKDSHFHVVSLSRRFGQTQAFQAGIDAAQGDIIVTMDGDLQNDPEDIPALVDMLEKGRYGVVSGWRYERKDPFAKRFFSKLQTGMMRKLTGVDIHDSVCALKAYRADALKSVRLYGEMHRYIPALIASKGYSVGEMKVRHHARRFGKTKYGARRLFKGFLDLLYVKFWTDFSTRPLHAFGSIGVGMAALGTLIAAYKVLIQKLLFGVPLDVGPLLLLSVMLILLGFQIVIFGFLAEIIIRIYYQSSKERTYTIAE
ncbi:MAG: glycosyltransferase family 2 protein [Candidatus Aenigmarchaeota archaeon]|nr:glycosyltransferase family 2 protein [Candidatus Aenigmarchaeota archaeon]